MNMNADAADQILRITLSSGEYFLKLSGKSADLIFKLLAKALKDNKQTKGKARLETMLKTDKELKVFQIPGDKVKQFTAESKRYGVLFCALEDNSSNDNLVDILVRSQDAAKIDRIFERIEFASANIASVESSVRKDLEQKKAPLKEDPSSLETTKTMEKLFPNYKEKTEMQNPEQAQTEKSPPSEPFSKNSNQEYNKSGADERESKPSVRKELEKFKAEIKMEEKKEQKNKTFQQTIPTRNSKPKFKDKER
jgi:hypothetical protein